MFSSCGLKWRNAQTKFLHRRVKFGSTSKMRTIKLTEASENFTYKSTATSVVLNWEVSLNLKNIQTISLSQIQLNHVTTFKNFDESNFIPIFCNLIERSATNPRRELHRTLLPPYDTFINDTHGGGKL